MNSSQPDELVNWIPWKLSGTLCNWLYLSNKKFTEPFFNDTISVCRNFSENNKPYKVTSDLGIMTEWSEDIDALNPFFFLMIRRPPRSTLLSQLLCSDETNVVLSEVPFFDELLRLPYKNSIDIKIINNYLSAAIKFYGRKRNENEKHIFIKTDSWHLYF